MARILIVEDSLDVHALLVETLQAEEHEVRGAQDRAAGTVTASVRVPDGALATEESASR